MIVIAACGPSLTVEQCEATRGYEVMAVSDAYRLLPHARRVYSADLEWWRLHHGRVDNQACYTLSPIAARLYGLTCVGMVGKTADSLGTIANGSCSGTHALHLSYLLGYRRLVLIGYDYQHGADGQRHWFGDHPSGLRNAPSTATWLARLPAVVSMLNGMGCSIVNCSGATAIPESVIPRANLTEVLGA